MFVRSTDSGWTVQTPAKINLSLEILGRRHDGFHQVETLMVPVRLFDRLRFQPSDEPLSLAIHALPRTAPSDASPLPTDHRNLAMQAAVRLAQVAGCSPTGKMELWKRIPSEAGLGGGSSDAAAALVAANKAWGLGYSRQRLASIAAEIGTDVPFFIHGGAALATGRGEKIEPVHLPAGLPLVLVQPPVGLATPQVFQSLGLAKGESAAGKDNHFEEHFEERSQGRSRSRCRKLLAALQAGRPAIVWRDWVRNSLQPAAEQMTEWIGRIRHAMSRLPVVAHQMTGSGSSYFSICRTWREAQQVAARLRGQAWPVVVATTTCL